MSLKRASRNSNKCRLFVFQLTTAKTWKPDRPMGKAKQKRLQGRDPILKKAMKLGFIITPGGNHWVVKHPKGGTIVVSYNGHNKRSRILELKTDQDLDQIVERHKDD